MNLTSSKNNLCVGTASVFQCPILLQLQALPVCYPYRKQGKQNWMLVHLEYLPMTKASGDTGHMQGKLELALGSVSNSLRKSHLIFLRHVFFSPLRWKTYSILYHFSWIFNDKINVVTIVKITWKFKDD